MKVYALIREVLLALKMWKEEVFYLGTKRSTDWGIMGKSLVVANSKV